MSDKKPVKSYRRGAIGVSIWRKEIQTADGAKVIYDVTPSRAFTRDDGKTFEYTDTYNSDDVPTLAALLSLAFAWVVSQTAKE
jgi:hypothetical protein